MVLRGIVHRHLRCVSRDRSARPPLGKKTTWALYFMLACGFWLTFKQFEPTLWPVVEDFQITSAVDHGDRVIIYGEFNKTRDCTFIDVVGYSGKQYVSVSFGLNPDAPVTSRLVREQTYGPWILVPKVPQLELYSRHICATGTVTTKLFSGALVL